jgi:hypothetical protein
MASEREEGTEGPAELITQPGKQNLVPVGRTWPVERLRGEVTTRTLAAASNLQ